MEIWFKSLSPKEKAKLRMERSAWGRDGGQMITSKLRRTRTFRKNEKTEKTNKAARLALPDVIANQVFLGVPWRSVRPKYEKAIDKLRSKSPLSFMIVGRADSQDAEDLLEVIKVRLQSSSYAIFDATAGNPNVSLEYGFAEARDIPRVLYLSTHGRVTRPSADAAIIADLAGKRRNQ